MALVFAELRATLAQTGKMLCTCLSLFFNNMHRHVDQSNIKCLCDQKSIVVATSIVYFFVASRLRRPAKENRKQIKLYYFCQKHRRRENYFTRICKINTCVIKARFTYLGDFVAAAIQRNFCRAAVATSYDFIAI